MVSKKSLTKKKSKNIERKIFFESETFLVSCFFRGRNELLAFPMLNHPILGVFDSEKQRKSPYFSNASITKIVEQDPIIRVKKNKDHNLKKNVFRFFFNFWDFFFYVFNMKKIFYSDFQRKM